MAGSIVIMPKVKRSRRNWMNSFQSIGHTVQLRGDLNTLSAMWRLRRYKARRAVFGVVLLLQHHEHVFHGIRAELRRDLLWCAECDEVAAGEEGETLAALRFVHVVRRDEDCRAT